MQAPAIPILDLFAPELLVDPYPRYAQLRANPGVIYRSSSRGGRQLTVLSRYADVQLALRDPRFGRSAYGHRLRANLGDGPLARSFADWMLFQDPPDHTRLRRTVSQAFAPRAVELMRAQVRSIVSRLLDALEHRPHFDLIADFAAPLPVLVICELLGIPRRDRGQFTEWSTALAASLDHLTSPEANGLRRGDAGAAGLTAYFQDLLAKRRAAPGDDLVSELLRSSGDASGMNEDELLATCVLLFFAGHETTVNVIGNGMLALLRAPDQLAALRTSPETAVDAVEELLRFDGPVQRSARVAVADVELAEGDVIRAGETVILLLGAANRDGDQFDNPDQLDLARPDAMRHLSFGAGIHYCLGAPLARLEAQIALAELVQRFPRLRLLTRQPAWRPTFGLRGLQSLPVAA